MALIVSVLIVAVLFYYSPLLAGAVAILAALYFYKSFQRTKYMTDEEVDMAIRLKSIQDPIERKNIKEEIERRINERKAADKYQDRAITSEHQSKIKYYFRWLAVLPGAVVSAAIVVFPIHWIIMFIQYTGTEVYADGTITYNNFIAAIPPDVLEYFAYAFSTPFVIIVVGAYIAPSLKFTTAKILSGILFLIFAYLAFISDADFVFTGLHFAATVALNLSGIFVALFVVKKYHLQRQES